MMIVRIINNKAKHAYLVISSIILNRFIIDVQEEMMDAILYLEAAKRCLNDEIEEAMIKRSNGGGLNYNF